MQSLNKWIGWGVEKREAVTLYGEASQGSVKLRMCETTQQRRMRISRAHCSLASAHWLHSQGK